MTTEKGHTGIGGRRPDSRASAARLARRRNGGHGRRRRGPAATEDSDPFPGSSRPSRGAVFLLVSIRLPTTATDDPRGRRGSEHDVPGAPAARPATRPGRSRSSSRFEFRPRTHRYAAHAWTATWARDATAELAWRRPRASCAATCVARIRPRTQERHLPPAGHPRHACGGPWGTGDRARECRPRPAWRLAPVNSQKTAWSRDR